MDFWSGINDIRDTHAAVSFESLFPFFARLSLDSLYDAAFSLGITLNATEFPFVFRSGLVALLFASLVAISPSLLGVAMIDIIYVIIPFIILAAVLIDQFLSFLRNFETILPVKSPSL